MVHCQLHLCNINRLDIPEGVNLIWISQSTEYSNYVLIVRIGCDFNRQLSMFDSNALPTEISWATICWNIWAILLPQYNTIKKMAFKKSQHIISHMWLEVLKQNIWKCILKTIVYHHLAIIYVNIYIVYFRIWKSIVYFVLPSCLNIMAERDVQIQTF